MGTLIRWSVVILVALGRPPVAAVVVAAPQVSVADMAAAYLVHFVRFTTWPTHVLPDGAPVVLCVGGSDGVADSLVRLTQDQTADGRLLSVRRTNPDGAVAGCHVFYGANLQGDRAQQFIRSTAGLPILTVSNTTDFAERGGVVTFYLDSGRLRFAVNRDAADRARLRISSRLLSLARIVRS